jgi:hypothetical protein
MYTAACNVHCTFLLVEKTLASPIGLYPVGLSSNYLCWYLRRILHIYVCIYIYICVCVCVFVCVISELHSLDGQSNVPLYLEYERFWIKNNRHRRFFAWRHLEAGQYVAQSGLHLHQSETHSCKENKKNSCQELRNAGVFTISMSSPSIALNEIYYVKYYRYNTICRRQETNFSDLRIFIIQSGKWQS